MQSRPLSTDIAIAPIMLGTNIFGLNCTEADAHRLLDRFVERGFNAVDTADCYPHHSMTGKPGPNGALSEEIIGRWIAKTGRRDALVISTKVGEWQARRGLSAANIEAAVEDSLRRLQTDHVDVYFAHISDPDTPQEETMRAFDRLVKSGKVSILGASHYPVPLLEDALAVSRNHGLARYAVLQPGYNLHDREPFESVLLPIVQRHGMGVVPYFGLASGFLSGKYRSQADLNGRMRGGMVAHYLTPRGFAILDALDEVAAQTGATPAKIAIAWLIAQPGVTAPIVSATSIAQLDDLLDAADIALSDEHLALLDRASAPQLAA